MYGRVVENNVHLKSSELHIPPLLSVIKRYIIQWFMYTGYEVDKIDHMNQYRITHKSTNLEDIV